MDNNTNIDLLLYGIFFIPLALFLLIWGLIDIWKNKTKRKKWITALIAFAVIVIPIVGPIVYLRITTTSLSRYRGPIR